MHVLGQRASDLPNDLVCQENSGSWDTKNSHSLCPRNETVWFYNVIMCLKDADEMANSVDSDQTARSGAVWSGSALFVQTYLSQYA